MCLRSGNGARRAVMTAVVSICAVPRKFEFGTGTRARILKGSRTRVSGSLICQNERIALQFNVAIQSRVIGKLLVLSRFLQFPRERQ